MHARLIDSLIGQTTFLLPLWKGGGKYIATTVTLFLKVTTILISKSLPNCYYMYAKIINSLLATFLLSGKKGGN